MKKPFVVGVLLVAALGWAGKPERDKQSEVSKLLQTHAKSVKTACGCEPRIVVKWSSYKTAHDMSRISDAAEAFADAAEKQCERADDRKAFCSGVAGVEISYGPYAEIARQLAFDDKLFRALSNESSYHWEGQYAAVLEKL